MYVEEEISQLLPLNFLYNENFLLQFKTEQKKQLKEKKVILYFT